MALRIEALENLDALQDIEPEWRAVWRRDPAATPFQSPAWLIPWTQWLWGGGRLSVLTVRDGAELVAVAPFFLWGYGRQPEIIRVSLLGAGISDHLGIVAAPEHELAAARAILDHLASIAGEWHVCDLQELRPGCPLLRVEMPRGFASQDGPSGVCPTLTLPRSMDELLERLDARFRRNLRVAEKRLAAAGATFAPVASDRVRDGVEELIRLHEARWQERRESGMLCTPALQSFHLDAAPRLAREGLVRLGELRIGGAVAAVQYNLCRDRRIFAYLSGFDPAHQRSSPGAALLAFSIRCAIEEGAAQFDFLRNGESFKYQWGARDRVNRKLMVSHSAAYAQEVA
jgi:CelD/BcsL family acetyltransferase involved in cellulose biosynthesis